MPPAIASPAHPPRHGRRSCPVGRRAIDAFTLVELLVSMSVLSLIMVLAAQMVGQTLRVTSASNKQMDAASMGRIVLDRFVNDFATAILSNGASALYYTALSGTTPEPTANSAIGFIARTRARTTNTTTLANDVRGATVGYKVKDLAFPYGSNKANPTVYLPALQRGDGRFTYATANTSGSNYAAFSANEILGTKFPRIPHDLCVNAGDENVLSWQGVGDGVLRFHVSFLLDDGSTVQTLQQGAARNATCLGFIGADGSGASLPNASSPALPIAFSAAVSADANRRYVKGLIVGVVVLDEATLRLAYAVDNAYPATLAGQLGRPTVDGETPVGVWQKNLSRVAFLPVRQNIRFYQRFYPVSF